MHFVADGCIRLCQNRLMSRMLAQLVCHDVYGGATQPMSLTKVHSSRR